MLGKNNQYKFQKLQDQKVKKKMKKKGKQWITSTLTVTALGFGFFSFTSMITHADQTTVQQENKDAPSNQASEVHTSEAPQEPVSTDANHYETTHEQPQASVPNDVTNNQDQAKTISPDASQSDQDKYKPQVDAKADNTTKQDDDKVTPSNVVTDQQANGQDNSHDQKNNIDNADQSKKEQPSSEQDDHKQDNTGQADKKAQKNIEPKTPVAKKWDEKQATTNQDQTTPDQAHKDDKVAPKFDTMKINGVDKVNVAVQNPQGQVITHIPLNQEQLPQGYDGKTPLTFEQVKAATGTVKSTAGKRDTVIPAPDKDGNYNWNADQFTTAKAKNAVHSGNWGTAQWFMDKNNNLFVSNGELSNDKNNNIHSNYSNRYSSLDLGSKVFSVIDGNETTGVYDYTNGAIYDNDLTPLADQHFSSSSFTFRISKSVQTISTSFQQSQTQGLASSIIQKVGMNNIRLNSVNFTSLVNLPKDSSNLFSKNLSQYLNGNFRENGKMTYTVKLISYYNSFIEDNDNVDVPLETKQGYDGSHDDSSINNVTPSTNMTIGKITGYNNMNTSQTTNMSNMFGGQAVDPDVSGFDFSNTTDVSGMAAGTHMTNLDLSHSDLSKVTDFSNMANTPTLRTANLNNDTIQNSSNKTNMLNGNVQEVSFNKKRAA